MPSVVVSGANPLKRLRCLSSTSSSPPVSAVHVFVSGFALTRVQPGVFLNNAGVQNSIKESLEAGLKEYIHEKTQVVFEPESARHHTVLHLDVLIVRPGFMLLFSFCQQVTWSWNPNGIGGTCKGTRKGSIVEPSGNSIVADSCNNGCAITFTCKKGADGKLSAGHTSGPPCNNNYEGPLSCI